jgi:hypothetical protein
MFRVRNNRAANRAESPDPVAELMNEVGSELGVDENSRRLNQDPKQFAERLKQEIRNRT